MPSSLMLQRPMITFNWFGKMILILPLSAVFGTLLFNLKERYSVASPSIMLDPRLLT